MDELDSEPTLEEIFQGQDQLSSNSAPGKDERIYQVSVQI